MEDISIEKISELLNSPDLVKNIQSVLGQIGTTQEEKPDIIIENNSSETTSQGIDTSQNAEISNIVSSISSFLSENKAERIALLNALKPFLSNEKQALLDSVLQILKLSNILSVTNLFK